MSFDTRVTTCLENLEMSGILTPVREVSEKKSCPEKMAIKVLLLMALALCFYEITVNLIV